mmetsp:Transcript_33745/g.73860  ORF Transcript_33745/g.73860 Transcript_33745/m.73860 type:complete len:259 (+) Transcript_33745:61-837(+)
MAPDAESWGSPPRPLFLCFADASDADLERVAAAETKAEAKALLKSIMGVDQGAGPRAEILADFHYHTYAFCISSGFSAEQTSTVLSIMKIVLDNAIRGKLQHDEAFSIFKSWLLKHSVERPPRSVGIFTFEDVQAITAYIHDTFFRTYRLYLYAFTSQCDLIVDARVADASTTAPLRPFVLKPDDIVDPMAQPEFEHLFQQSEQMKAEEARRQAEKEPEDRATTIKRQVDEGVKKLMETFDVKLREQDERFHKLLDGK